MWQRLYTLILAVSLSVMLGTPFVSHHHHGSKVCTAKEYCQHDHETNDRHTTHHGDTSPCAERGDCVVSRTTDNERAPQPQQSDFYAIAVYPCMADHASQPYTVISVVADSGRPSQAIFKMASLRGPPDRKC